MVRTPMITAVLWAALAIPAAAAGVLYDCDLNAKRAMGWVSPKLAIFIDAKGGTQVIDGAILHYTGGSGDSTDAPTRRCGAHHMEHKRRHRCKP